MNKTVVLVAVAVVASVLGPSTLIRAQTADEEALKEVIRAETMAFYGRDLDNGWRDGPMTQRPVVANRQRLLQRYDWLGRDCRGYVEVPEG